MNDVYAAAREVQELFERHGWKSCLIGGLAVIRWGRKRTTDDADFTLLTGFGDEKQFLDVIAAQFREREPDEINFALSARVYRGYASNGMPVDIALAAFPFEEEMIDRAEPYEFMPGCVLRVCAVQDLIVMKAFAGRSQDLADLQYLIAWHWKSLDWNFIERQLSEICDMSENVTSVPKLAELRSEIDRKLRSRRKRS